MSALIEKRQQLADKLANVMSERNHSIDERVAAYRAQLESEPISPEALEIKKVIEAIDEVIAYEASIAEPVVNVQPAVEQAPVVEPVIVEPVIETPIAEPIIEAPVIETPIVEQHVAIESRPGMASITIPERR